MADMTEVVRIVAEVVADVQRLCAEVERLRALLAGLCGAVEHSAPRYGVDEDWRDVDTLRLRLDAAKALLAKHEETDQ